MNTLTKAAKIQTAIQLMKEVERYYKIEEDALEHPLMSWLEKNHTAIADEYVAYVRNECLKVTEEILKGITK